jgi:hypothetical protein
MSLATTVRAMVDAGCTAEQIAVVVAAHEAEAENKRKAKRANTAARQRRFRERHGHVTHVTPVTPSNGDNALPSPQEEDQPPTDPRYLASLGIDDGKARARARAGKLGERLPEGWTPSPELQAFAAGLGIVNGRLEAAVAEFRDYWRGVPGQRGRKLDWPATFRNRLRETAGKQTRTAHGNGSQKGSIVDAGRRLTERLIAERREREMRAGNSGNDGDPTVRLLPGVGR